jgi:exosortase/archaeosortase family protein
MFLVGVFIAPGFSLRHRLFALAFLPVLFLGNVVRIMLGVLAGVHFSADASIFFHNTFGQVLIFFWVLICFIVWLKVTDNFPKDSLEKDLEKDNLEKNLEKDSEEGDGI